MPRLTEETKTARRTAIVDAAVTCFVRRGYGGTSMADIIKESGASSGSIYSHFGSKEDILRAAVDANIEATSLAIRSVGESSRVAPPRVLIVGMRSKVLPTANPGLLVKIWSEAGTSTEIREMVLDVMHRMRTLFADLLDPWADINAPAGVASRDFALANADKMILIIHGFALRLAIDTTIDPDAFFAEMATMLPE